MAPDPDLSGEPRGQAAVGLLPSPAELDEPSARAAPTRALVLAAEPGAPAQARAQLRAFLAPEHLPAQRLYELQLLVSELVSNAVRHGSRAGDAVEVAFERLAGELRVLVTDAGRAASAPTVREQRSSEPSGRGLSAVQRLSDEWAAEMRGRRRAVWFRVALRPRPAAA